MEYKLHFKLIFFGIILLSIFLRFYQLGSNPPSLDWDEASIGYNAYSILKTGADEYGNRFPLSFRSFDDFKPPVYVYLAVPSVAVFGLNNFAVRLPAAVIGVVMVIAVYFLVIEILEKWDKKEKYWIALTASFLLAVSPWHLQFSRAAFEGNIGICFLVISILFFMKGLKKAWYYLPFSLFFVLSIYSYHSFRLIDPLLLFLLSLLFNKTLMKQKVISGIAILLIVIFSYPIYINVNGPKGAGARLSMVTIFSDPVLNRLSAEEVLRAKENGNFINSIIYNRRFIFIPKMISGYFDHFNFDFLFLHGDSGVQHHAYNMGMLYLWDLPFILAGIIYLIKKRDKRILFLLCFFLAAPLPASITSGTPHPVRAIAMIPAFQIFTAVGFVALIYLLQKMRLGKVLISAVVILLLINIIYYLKSYYTDTPVKYGYFWQYGNKEAVAYAKEHEKEYDHIIMSYEYDQPYVYYLFYNKIDPAWYQQNWDYSGNGSIDRFYRKIGKYEFTKINSFHLNMRKTLIIGAPSEIPDGRGQLKKEIFFPDGRLAYKIIEV